MRKVSIAEPITELRHVRIADNGEPLVDFLDFCPELILDRPRFAYKRETLVRESVARMLCQAAKSLPKGYRLAVIEGWRPPHIQRRMYLSTWRRFAEQHPDWSEVKLKRVVNRFTAPINDPRVPPPHSTGGAVDVYLRRDDGAPVDFSAPYDWLDARCFPFDAPNLAPEALRHREMLAEALLPTGITNYPSEFWHWSYGDQGWAYRGGHPHALYGRTMPPGYTAPPEDDLDEPMDFLPQ